MKLEVKEMESFPENCNPYHHDAFHMGRDIGENLMMMHANHPSEKMNYFILINTKTGKRVKVTISEEE